MATDTAGELYRFHAFLSEKLARGLTQISPEEALDLWRADHPVAEESARDVAAVKEALADMEAGDVGLPLDQFDREFRKRHSMPANE